MLSDTVMNNLYIVYTTEHSPKHGVRVLGEQAGLHDKPGVVHHQGDLVWLARDWHHATPPLAAPVDPRPRAAVLGSCSSERSGGVGGGLRRGWIVPQPPVRSVSSHVIVVVLRVTAGAHVENPLLASHANNILVTITLNLAWPSSGCSEAALKLAELGTRTL